MRISGRRVFHLALGLGSVAVLLLMPWASTFDVIPGVSAQQGCNQTVDADCDEVPDTRDNCRYTPNPGQENNDASEEAAPFIRGDVCDTDDDNDGVADDGGLGSACPSTDTCQSAKTCSISRTPCAVTADCNGGSQQDFCLLQIQSCLLGGGPCNSNADCPAIPDTCGNRCAASNASCDPLNDRCFASGCDDNCPLVKNVLQEDMDGDGAGDSCDNCITVVNPSQADSDLDSLGDACDPDLDGDGFSQDLSISPVCSVQPDVNGNPPSPPNPACRDNCPAEFNLSQWDQDRDLIGTVCDNCFVLYNPSQLDADGDSAGNGCDNCVSTPNSNQANMDTDALGDACDNCDGVDNNNQFDQDFDGLGNVCDRCPSAFDPSQTDTDGDGAGDACDPCPADASNVFPFGDRDLDGICDSTDNCIGVANANQLDADGDGQGDVCDCDRDGDGLNDKSDRIVDGNCFPFLGCFTTTEACFTDQTCYDTVRGTSSPACNRTGGLTTPCCIDNCPDAGNAGQANGDGDNEGDVCDPTPLVQDPGPGASFDLDGDGASDAADNCPAAFNPAQSDLDGDSLGDLCDSDADADLVADMVDNCKLLANPTQDDADGDLVGDLCDNCRFASNAKQEDGDRDLQGDRCDPDDGQIVLQFDDPSAVTWDGEASFDRWITIVGDLSVLSGSGQYVQDPGTYPLAAVHCDGTSASMDVGSISLAPGQAVFIFTGGLTDLIENGFGQATDGSKRVIQDLCP